MRNLEKKSMRSMHESRARKKHERTPVHHTYSVLLAERNCVITHRARTASPIEPHFLDARLRTILRNTKRLISGRHYQHTLHCRPDCLQALKALLPVDLCRNAVHGHHVISSIAHLAKQTAAEIFADHAIRPPSQCDEGRENPERPESWSLGEPPDT